MSREVIVRGKPKEPPLDYCVSWDNDRGAICGNDLPCETHVLHRGVVIGVVPLEDQFRKPSAPAVPAQARDWQVCPKTGGEHKWDPGIVGCVACGVYESAIEFATPQVEDATEVPCDHKNGCAHVTPYAEWAAPTVRGKGLIRKRWDAPKLIIGEDEEPSAEAASAPAPALRQAQDTAADRVAVELPRWVYEWFLRRRWYEADPNDMHDPLLATTDACRAALRQEARE